MDTRLISAPDGDHKPVYQLRYGTGDVEVTEEQFFRESYMRGTPRRMLYPAAAYEALQKENEAQAKRIVLLEYDVKHLKDALRAYGDEDIDDDED